MTDSLQARTDQMATKLDAKPKRTKRPTIRERAYDMICPNCGASTMPDEGKRNGVGKMFCGKACKVGFQNRRIARGAVIASWAMAWRVDRGSGEIAQGSFQQLCNILDIFNAQDAADGRERADLYAAKMLAGGSLFIDRQRGPKEKNA